MRLPSLLVFVILWVDTHCWTYKVFCFTRPNLQGNYLSYDTNDSTSNINCCNAGSKFSGITITSVNNTLDIYAAANCSPNKFGYDVQCYSTNDQCIGNEHFITVITSTPANIACCQRGRSFRISSLENLYCFPCIEEPSPEGSAVQTVSTDPSPEEPLKQPLVIKAWYTSYCFLKKSLNGDYVEYRGESLDHLWDCCLFGAASVGFILDRADGSWDAVSGIDCPYFTQDNEFKCYAGNNLCEEDSKPTLEKVPLTTCNGMASFRANNQCISCKGSTLTKSRRNHLKKKFVSSKSYQIALHPSFLTLVVWLILACGNY